MAPTIDLSPATFTRLQAHAVPLIDTIESVINRLLDAYETNGGTLAGSGGSDHVDPAVRRFNPNTPPDLTHTKVMAIEFGGKPLSRSETNWNGLLIVAIREARAKVASTTDLRRLAIVNLVDGKKADEGYRFLPEMGISVQGQDANGAWKGACHIAQQLGRELKARFIWRDKEGAAFPGAIGEFYIKGRV